MTNSITEQLGSSLKATGMLDQPIYLKCFTLGVRRHHHTAIMMHKIIHNRAPEYLTEAFHLLRDSTAYNLRDANFNLALQKLSPTPKTYKKAFHTTLLSYGIPFHLRLKQNLLSLQVFRKFIRTLGLNDIN